MTRFWVEQISPLQVERPFKYWNTMVKASWATKCACNDKYSNISLKCDFFCISVLIETFLPWSKIKEQAEFEDKKCDLARVGPLLKYKH